jgi:DNA helicase-2/ATP-dependent DNA helicase PcrA
MVVAEARVDPVSSFPVLLPPAAPPASQAAAGLLRGLNREQRSAVTHGEGPALVIAGPGTGKTEVVTRRVAWLIATKRALPREILALTFTDNAAQEMQARVDVLVPYGQADAAIHTFHAFGDRLLREHAFELGLGSDVRLLSRPELIVFLREHLFELGLERYRPLGDPTRFLGALVDFFGHAKDEDVGPKDLELHATALAATALDAADAEARAAIVDLANGRSELARAFNSYTRLMAAHGHIDHADQVAAALTLLRTRPSVAAELGRRYRYVLVDELQDTNKAQVELVVAISTRNHNVMAVGDPDQGIYGFRGARADNVQRFTRSLARARTIRLRRNYRSLAPVVRAAQNVLRAAHPVVAGLGQQVAHRRGAGTPLRHLSFATPEAEADAVAAEIERRILAGARPADFCVLLRANSDSADFARSLRVRGIDVDTGSRGALVDVPSVRALLAFVRLVADPRDSLEAFTLAAAEPYALDSATLGRLLTSSRRRNRTLLDALREARASGDPSISDETRRHATLLVDHVDKAVAMSATSTSGEVVYDYLRRSGALARLAAANADSPSDARSVARFCELLRSRAALLDQDRIAFLAPALELSDVTADLDGDAVDRNAVRVLTVHRAKGLEFRTVFVSGLVDGRFPVRSRPPVLSLPDELTADVVDDARALSEERRLFYVAVTRARDEVILTSHEFGPHGRGRRRPSPFITEAIDAPVATLEAASPIPAPATDDQLARILVPPTPAAAAAASEARLTLSFSQIDEYLTCPERYRLRYDIGIPTPPHHALSYGTAIHQAIAAFHTAQARGSVLSEDELIEELRRAWQPDGYLSREHEDARFAAGADALRVFRAQQISAGGTPPTAIERPFSFRLGRDEIRGRIDRVDASADGAVITDYKSSDVRDQKRADTKARDSLQLQVYALAYQAETGAVPKRVQLHFVESGVVGSTTPTAERLDKARDKLAAAADQIRARRFGPKPSAIACGYCPFRTICTSSAA